MVVPRFVVALVAILAVLPFGLAAQPGDAGSGADAPNTPEAAMPLPYGTYDGYLGNNGDWYRMGSASSTPVCVTVAMTSEANSTAELRVDTGTTLYTISGDGDPSADTALAVGSVASVLYGVLPTLNPANNQPARPGYYTFTVLGRTPAELGTGDAGTGGDVGNDLGSAHAITDVCLTGMVQKTLDVRDVYTFEGTQGSSVRLGFVQFGAHEAAKLTLRAPGGATLATFASGQTLVVQLPATGTYDVTVSAPDTIQSATQKSGHTGVVEQVRYLFSFDKDDPGPQPCRPNCL